MSETTNQIQGKLIWIGEIEDKSDKFKILDFAIETDDPQYPQKIKLQAINKTCDAIKALSLGSVINCHYNLKGREYQGKYYTTVTVWKFDIINKA
jgi:single-strand DNA-binding protein